MRIVGRVGRGDRSERRLADLAAEGAGARPVDRAVDDDAM